MEETGGDVLSEVTSYQVKHMAWIGEEFISIRIEAVVSRSL